MENKFENRDFEHFLKQNANQYRMFPSEKVWKGINNTLHTRRRWYGIGLILLLLSTAAVTGIMLSPIGKKQPVAIATNEANLSTIKDTPTEIAEPVIISPAKASNKKNTAIVSPDNTQKNLFTLSKTIVKSNPASTYTSSVIPEENKTDKQPNVVDQEIAVISKPTTSRQPILKANKPTPVKNIDPVITNTIESEILVTTPLNENEAVEIESNSIKEKDIYPMTIESVVNAYQHIQKTKKLTWHLYATPSVTYRKLDDNKPFLAAASSSTVYTFSDINSLVTHKPDIGLQIGISAGYPVSKAITLKGGLQFNVSRYNIRASDHSSEIATIALTSSYGRTNSVTAVTNLRNVGGYSASWLHNKYVSASIPLGAEVKLSSKSKTIIGVGATLEPTYILGNRAYLLSTDLKNYAEVPSLTRKWNINTGFELFAGYSSGNVDWRVGPQFRYQLFSSFYDTYPIKEHLFDFGIKLGITLK